MTITSAGKTGSDSGARRSSRRLALFAAMLVAAVPLPLSATPFTPADDAVVLETMPDARSAGAREARALNATLGRTPRDMVLATKVARLDITQASALGDPRYLGRAEAALAPWPQSLSSPPAVLLLRAMILQSNHDFATSLLDLQRVLAAEPENSQAWLTRAAIRQAQADYRGAGADCGQFATRTLGLAADTCTAGVMSLSGRAPLALRAMTVSLTQNAAELKASPAVAVWALTLAAEIAARLDDPSADARFRAALDAGPDDPYLLAARSDWLLAHHRSGEVEPLLAGKTRIDPLLLRLAMAEQDTGSAALAGHIADLSARFDASRRRGDTVHRREEAMFTLDLLHDPARALALATANWTVQREPSDALILMRTAIAAHRPESAAPALQWFAQNHVQDTTIAACADTLRDMKPESAAH